MNFRAKTILGVALIEGVLLAILIFVSLQLLQASKAEELYARTLTTARMFASTTKDAVLSTDMASLESVVQEVMSNPGVVYARVRGRHGMVLAQAGEAAVLAREFRPDATYKVDDGVIDVAADIAVEGEKYGQVDLGFSTAEVAQVLANARKEMAFIAVTEMFLVGLFSFVLGSYLTKGLSALKAGTQRVATGDVGHTLPVQGRDELAQTLRAFNEMSQRLKEHYDERKRAEEALSKLNADLERRVQVRTEELATAYEKIEYQALHDSLTKLPNRTLFHDRLEQTILTGHREKRLFALVMLDLNRFKETNDTLGHHAGDLVLQETAIRLRNGLRQSDTVARLGGDEFALILPTVADMKSAILTLEKIQALFQAPMTIDGQSVEISPSMGAALFPKDGDTADLLLRHADAAMYDAKRRRAGIAIYTADLAPTGKERASLQHELRAGIAAGQLVLHYQPKFDLASDRVTGVEALVRWQHPRHGLLFPGDFIPAAENSGLIKPLTAWVLAESLRQIKLWENDGLDLSVSINVSIANLLDADFPKLVASNLRNAGVPAAKLELEISEVGIMVEPPRAIAALTELSDLGVNIIIDDFGTGYSSMAYLKRLPIAKIKVDRSFVKDMLSNDSDAVIVRSIIGLGHNLGLNVVAEGVESRDVWDQLKTLGCDSAQGYCMSRPVPALEIEALVRKGAITTA